MATNLKLVNSTYIFKSANPFDMNEIKQTFRHSENARSRGNRCFTYLLHRHENATMLFYKSGKIVCLGIKNEDQLEKITSYLENTLKRPINVVVTNLVFSGRIKPTNLNLLYEKIRKNRNDYFGYYTPEGYNGFVFNYNKNTKVIIFRTGKIIITGLTSFGKAQEVLAFLNSIN